MDNSTGIDYLDKKFCQNYDMYLIAEAMQVVTGGIFIEAADVPTEMMFHVGAITELHVIDDDNDPVYELHYALELVEGGKDENRYAFTVHPKNSASGYVFLFVDGMYVGYIEA
jgi:hypothetical protein